MRLSKNAKNAPLDTLWTKKDFVNRILLELSNSVSNTLLFQIVPLVLKDTTLKTQNAPKCTILKTVWSTNKMPLQLFVPDVLMIIIFPLKICVPKELNYQIFLYVWNSHTNLKNVTNAWKDTFQPMIDFVVSLLSKTVYNMRFQTK